jgi:hypothetical protein
MQANKSRCLFYCLGAVATLLKDQQHTNNKGHIMAADIHTFTVGSRQFQMYTIQPFAATVHAMKLKKILEKGLSNGLDSNVVSVISNIDENTLKEVIFPILAASVLTCTSEEKKLQTPADMDDIYSVEDLDEFFVTVWEVLKTNFGPFFRKMAKNLFGFDLDQVQWEKIRAVIKSALDKATAQELAKINPKSK